MDSQDLSGQLAREQKVVEKTLAGLLRREKGIPRRLKDAMGHSLLSGGKRLRPILLLWAYDAFAAGPYQSIVPRENALDAACAMEMLHTYSLIHDDLPAMDDDNLRRGCPTCHVAFDEATAILAGDALQALAFTVMARSSASAAGPLVQILGRAAGPSGMVGGQQDDLDSEGKDVDVRLIRRIHLGKTAALLAASLEAGAHLAGASQDACLKIHQAGLSLGLAFQGADDVLDVTATSEQLGKTVGKDQVAGKATWVRVEGLEKARIRTSRFGRKGLKELSEILPTGPACDRLLAMGAMMWNRDH
jgi:geranylgeranyl diphosphate synthase, type II